MPQCPLCSRNAKVEESHCVRCGGDLTALQGVRDLPAHLYNAGLEAARSGDSLGALLKVAASSQLGKQPEPWVVLGKLFANDGAQEYAQACFAKAQSLGASIHETWLGANGADQPAAVVGAPSTGDQPVALVNGSPEQHVVVPLAGQRAGPQLSGRWALAAAVLLATGIGLGWQMRGYEVQTVTVVQPQAPQRATEVAGLPGPRATPVASPPDPGVAVTPEQRVGTSAAVSVDEPEAEPQVASAEPPQDTHAEVPPPVVFASAPAVPVPATEPPTASARYVVQPGDSLWRIARSRLGAGQRWRALYKANRAEVKRPNRLVVGQALVIPIGPE